MKLLNKVALITGASRGIGEATAKKMAAEGAKLAIVATNKEKLERVAAEIDPSGERCLPLVCSIDNQENVKDMVNNVIEKYGRIDILVNNAGITRDAMFHKMTSDQWQQVLNTNLSGIFYLTQAVIPYMREQKYGKIVNISSTSAYGNIGQTNYAAAKAGVLGMTKSLAKELGRYNITVNATLPGLTNTDMVKTIPDEVMKGFYKQIPLERAAQPEEQANVICFLASDDSSYVTGAAIPVSGGALIV